LPFVGPERTDIHEVTLQGIHRKAEHLGRGFDDGGAIGAATVWLRVGNTLVTQAVRKPDAAIPIAARMPAPPAPTITTS
jgi:hypothetical protein